jgi:hypothetical protein
MALIVFVPGCVALTWWQASRALSGNALSWVYTFEWPIFAVYAVFMWWKLIHEEPVPEESAGRSEAGTGAGAHADTRPDAGAEGDAGADTGTDAGADEDRRQDDELAAYNRYLADLHASGRRKRW